MRIEWFLIIAELVGRLNELSIFAVGGCTIALGLAYMYNAIELERVYKPSRTILTCYAISILVLVATPTKSTLYIVGGVHYAKQLDLPNNPLVAKSMKVLEQKLDEILEGKRSK